MMSVIIFLVVIIGIIVQMAVKSRNVPKKSSEEQPLQPKKPAKPNRSASQTKPKPAEPVRRAPMEETILEAAKRNSLEVEFENEQDAIASENYMDAIYDLMVKGPQDQLSFQRDFLAEATEMLNSYVAPEKINEK